MEIPEGYLNKFRPLAVEKSGRPRNARDEMLDKFLARLNASRIADGYPKLRMGYVVTKLAGIPTEDLHAFYAKCETYKSFGAGFNYELKPRA